MLQNTVKDNIKYALEAAGYRSHTHNIELVYQTYLAGAGNGNFGNIIRSLKGFLKK